MCYWERYSYVRTKTNGLGTPVRASCLPRPPRNRLHAAQPGTPAGSATVSPQVTYTSNETLVAFVDSAAAYVKANGKEKALREFKTKTARSLRRALHLRL